MNKVRQEVSGENHDGWPYGKLEHWPPLTYRDRSLLTVEALSSFTDFLNTENKSDDNKELQPWIPFCEGRCAFCYFPVSCEKHNVPVYISALKKALSFYAKSKYVQSCVFNELYVGGGSPTVLSRDQIADILQFCRMNFNFRRDYSKVYCVHN